MPSSGCSTMAAFTLVLQHTELRREEARPGSRHVGDVLQCKCQERRLLHILFLRTSTPKSDFPDKKTNILTSGGDTMFT